MRACTHVLFALPFPKKGRPICPRPSLPLIFRARCVSICPTNALVAAKESEHPDKPYFITNQELIRTPDYYEESGADGYITSESYLTEKRLDGGEV